MIPRILLVLSLCSCTEIVYKDGTASFTRTSFGTNLQIMTLTATTDDHGNRTIQLEGYTSDQTEALKAVAEGAAKGAVKGIKP